MLSGSALIDLAHYLLSALRDRHGHLPATRWTKAAWTPVLAGLPSPRIQAKEGSEGRSDRAFRSELYSLSDWHKIPVSSLSRQTAEHLTVTEPPKTKTLADAERAHITAALRETDGVIGGSGGAAAKLGLPRTTLIAKMQRLGIPSGTRSRPDQPSQFARVIDDTSSRSKDRSTDDVRLMEAVAG